MNKVLHTEYRIEALNRGLWRRMSHPNTDRAVIERSLQQMQQKHGNIYRLVKIVTYVIPPTGNGKKE